jgi:hypothetical protein
MVLNHPRMLVTLRKERKISTRKTNLNTKVRGKGKKSFQCHHRGGANHIAKKYKFLQHLIDLYQKSLKGVGKAKGLYEAHFNIVSDEAMTSSKRPDEAAKSSPSTDDYIDGENMIIEYNSNDMFGDQEYAPFILLDFY